jgi:signal peptidase I
VARAEAELTQKAGPKFDEQLAGRLPEPTRAQLRRVRWELRLTSLWAPVTVFGLLFVVYLFIVEFHTPAFLWAQPLLKGVGFVMVLWFFGLIVVRNLVRPYARLRQARHHGMELVDDVGGIVNRHRAELSGPAQDELLGRSAALVQALVGRKVSAMEEELKALGAKADKLLVRWRKQSAFDFGMGFVKALAVALVIRTILIEPFRIPSGSMIPTLEIGDQIFVNKFIYGVRIPFTNYVPFTIVRKPGRGDVIVFNNPVDESKDFIKRVVGVSGDTVELRRSVLYLNGQAQPRELHRRGHTYFDNQMGAWEAFGVTLYKEQLSGHPYVTAQMGDRPEDFGPVVVPTDHVFVMGDNRDNSSDSRVGFVPGGRVEFVPHGNIKGKAMVIWLAIGYDGFLGGLFGGTGIKTQRFFLPVR